MEQGSKGRVGLGPGLLEPKWGLPGVWGVTPSALRAGIREGDCRNHCQWEAEGRGSASLLSK